MKLILVRHGESEFNKLIDIEGVKMFCGATDVGLTEHGKNQAKYLDGNDKLKDISKVYSSNLIRALDTAKLAMPNKEITVDERIRERSLGYFEKKYVKDMEKEFPELFKKEDKMKFRRDFIVKAPQGENYTDVSNRVKSFFQDLDFNKNEKIAIFSHMHCIRCMLYLLLGLKKEEVTKLTIPNCEIIEIEGSKLRRI